MYMVNNNELDNNKPFVNGEVSYWNDAKEFMSDQLVKSFEDKFKKFLIEKNYNKNEAQLFKTYCGEVIQYYATIAMLKHYNK